MEKSMLWGQILVFGVPTISPTFCLISTIFAFDTKEKKLTICAQFDYPPQKEKRGVILSLNQPKRKYDTMHAYN